MRSDGTTTDFSDSPDGLIVATSQDIPASWATWLGQKRADAWELRNASEHVHVASIPVVFVHKWLREGFNVYHEPVKVIEAKLRRENLTGFLATEKRVY